MPITSAKNNNSAPVNPDHVKTLAAWLKFQKKLAKLKQKRADIFKRADADYVNKKTEEIKKQLGL